VLSRSTTALAHSAKQALVAINRLVVLGELDDEIGNENQHKSGKEMERREIRIAWDEEEKKQKETNFEKIVGQQDIAEIATTTTQQTNPQLSPKQNAFQKNLLRKNKKNPSRVFRHESNSALKNDPKNDLELV